MEERVENTRQNQMRGRIVRMDVMGRRACIVAIQIYGWMRFSGNEIIKETSQIKNIQLIMEKQADGR